MNKIIVLLFLLLSFIGSSQETEKVIARQGHVSFFSHTSVENIEATNNQVLSIIDFSKKEIAISMLMNAFVFKKSLMHEHFNESYIESDKYPKATFTGDIIDLEPLEIEKQVKLIKGKLTIHGITKEVEIRTSIENFNGRYILSGDFDATVKDFNIKIPPVLAPNIAKIIAIKFRFEYEPYEK